MDCRCRHQSVLGVRIWAASRMVEMAFKRFMTLLSGTWAMNLYLRALGASVGDWVSFRLGMCLPLCPDQVIIKDGCANTPLAYHCQQIMISTSLDSAGSSTSALSGVPCSLKSQFISRRSNA